MSNCIGCDYYDSSVDCCNCDDYCYMDGIAKGIEKGKKEANKIIEPTIREIHDGVFNQGIKMGAEQLADWLVKYKVVLEPVMKEILRDFKGEKGIK